MPSPALSVAFWVMLFGAGVLGVASIAKVAPAIAVAGAVLFLSGGLMILLFAALDARRRGVGFGRATWQGVVQALRWILVLLP